MPFGLGSSTAERSGPDHGRCNNWSLSIDEGGRASKNLVHSFKIAISCRFGVYLQNLFVPPSEEKAAAADSGLIPAARVQRHRCYCSRRDTGVWHLDLTNQSLTLNERYMCVSSVSRGQK